MKKKKKVEERKQLYYLRIKKGSKIDRYIIIVSPFPGVSGSLEK